MVRWKVFPRKFCGGNACQLPSIFGLLHATIALSVNQVHPLNGPNYRTSCVQRVISRVLSVQGRILASLDFYSTASAASAASNLPHSGFCGEAWK
jgi:hypothetical protein